MNWVEPTNGVAIPAPAFGSGGFTISTMVDGGRNANGDFIGSVIGDDKFKVEMSFQGLSPDEIQNLLKLFDRQQGGHFVNTFRVYDPRIKDYRTMDMYVGDRSGKPYLVNASTGQPRFWTDVKANLIQV